MAMPVLVQPPGWPAPGKYADRVVGCFLAALCGDALGAAVENWPAYRIREDFPNGLTQFQKVRMGLGCYTGGCSS